MQEQNNVTNSLADTKWNSKYQIIFSPKYRRKVLYEEKIVYVFTIKHTTENKHIWNLGIFEREK